MNDEPILDTSLLREHFKSCYAAGMPRDQVELFTQSGYIPAHKQQRFHATCRECDLPGGPTMVLFGGARAGGKLLKLNTLVPTPAGWTTMGELECGDKVFGSDGRVCNVTYVSPRQYDKTYKLTFSDGTEIIAGASHQWVTETKSDRVKTTKTTQEIVDTLKLPGDGENNHAVINTKPLILPTAELPIAPYLLGLWLGDGDSDRGYITTVDTEIFRNIDIPYHHVSDIRYRVDGLTSLLRKNDLIKNKHIPFEYLRASYKQRLELLQGLMDTDGYVDTRGHCSFTNKSWKLTSYVYELLMTLGIKTTVREKNAKCNGKDCGIYYTMDFRTDLPVFKLQRKAERQVPTEPGHQSKKRFIVSAEEIEPELMCCITVDSEDHTYLVSKSFITTHNTHGSFCQAGLDDCQRFAGLKVLFLRIVQKSAKESFEDLIMRTFRNQQHEAGNNIVVFPNGSRIQYGGCRTPRDIKNYIGQEYDLIIIEELTQFPENYFSQITGSLRTSRTDGWRPRMYLTTNPGDVGHDWVKRMFVDVYRNHEETETRFIPAKSTDNPHINAEYQAYLDGIVDANLRARWRDGIWELPEGRAFPTYGDRHIITMSEYLHMKATGNWVHYRGIDFGTANPFACVWIGVEPTIGRVIAYRELYKAGLAAGQQADLIRQYTPGSDRIAISYCDPAMRIRQSTETSLVSAIEMYAAHKVYLTPGINDRTMGKMKIDNLLADRPDGKPGLYVVKSECVNLDYQLSNLQRDEKNPEDYMKCNWDHAADAFRYAISGVRDYRLVEPKKREEVMLHPLRRAFSNRRY